MTLSELLQKLGENKQESAKYYGKYKELKEQEDALKFELTDMLHEMGLKTAKGDLFTASIAEKPTIVIKNEKEVVEWLKNTPNIESDFYIGLKANEFKKMATVMLKDTGELANGTEVIVNESLSIRSNKK